MVLWLWLPGADTGRAETLKSYDFLPQWSPQAQFAGYYVAAAKGFYERRGLALTILRGGPERPVGAQLAAGLVDFGTLFLTEGLVLRDQGIPLVNVGQLVQRSALMLVAHKERGIRTPEDLNGRRVSVWEAFQLQPRAFFLRHELDVTVVPQGNNVNLFLMGGVDATSAMWYNEYYTILNAGIDTDEITTFRLADHGLNFPEDGIYCREETLQRDPAAVRAFVQGSIDGWRYAFDNPEEAIEIVMTHIQAANLPTNRVHQRWMLARMADIIRPAGHHRPMGTLTDSDLRFVAEQLHHSGILHTQPDYLEFHDPRPSTR
ncbi:MAG: ABC transporter substrate-binding protein [Desulfatitalea sp.]|nr:ABC transporter substrate-binding protein [Desulfatitalea sp.]